MNRLIEGAVSLLIVLGTSGAMLLSAGDDESEVVDRPMKESSS